MSIAGIVTIVGFGIMLGAVALYLIVISFILKKVSFTVGTVLIGVRAIADQCQPLGSVLNDIVGDVKAIDDALAALPLEDQPRALQASRGSRPFMPQG